MAFLDNPTIILAHIRQSHVTSDDTGMCEMVLIDHDVDLEKFHSSSANGGGGGGGETQASNGESQGYVYSQSVDITSSWDFGIRRRSNTGEWDGGVSRTWERFHFLFVSQKLQSGLHKAA